VALASRGLRKFGETEEKIEDNIARKQVQRQALKVLFKSFLVSVILTLIAYLIP